LRGPQPQMVRRGWGLHGSPRRARVTELPPVAARPCVARPQAWLASRLAAPVGPVPTSRPTLRWPQPALQEGLGSSPHAIADEAAATPSAPEPPLQQASEKCEPAGAANLPPALSPVGPKGASAAPGMISDGWLGAPSQDAGRVHVESDDPMSRPWRARGGKPD
jgi:hypothetical protein